MQPRTQAQAVEQRRCLGSRRGLDVDALQRRRAEHAEGGQDHAAAEADLERRGPAHPGGPGPELLDQRGAVFARPERRDGHDSNPDSAAVSGGGASPVSLASMAAATLSSGKASSTAR